MYKMRLVTFTACEIFQTCQIYNMRCILIWWNGMMMFMVIKMSSNGNFPSATIRIINEKCYICVVILRILILHHHLKCFAKFRVQIGKKRDSVSRKPFFLEWSHFHMDEKSNSHETRRNDANKLKRRFTSSNAGASEKETAISISDIPNACKMLFILTFLRNEWVKKRSQCKYFIWNVIEMRVMCQDKRATAESFD